MGNKFSKPGRHDGQKQRPQNRGNAQSNQKFSREQLIFRIETLREELEENPNLNEQRRVRIQEDMARYSEQLAKF